jgi:hypothetical protein
MAISYGTIIPMNCIDLDRFLAAAKTAQAETGTLDALTMRSRSARVTYRYQVAAESDTPESRRLRFQVIDGGRE